MKKVIITMLLILWPSISMAETWDTTTQRDSSGGDHHHHVDIPKREDPLGLGLDIEKDLTKHLGIAIEFRDDLRNQEKSTIAVLKIKL